MDSKKPTNVVKTAPVKNKINKEKEKPVVYRSSAREPRRVDNDEEEDDEDEESHSSHHEVDK